jgi:hypothetical protein
MFRTFKLNKRELNLLIFCCILIISALSYIVIIEPFCKRYESLKEEIQREQVKFLKLQKMLLLKEPTELSYLGMLPRLSQIGSDEERFALFLKEIELTSRRTNIYITSLKPINILEGVNFKEYVIRMEAEGGLDSLAKLLYALPESGQWISLKSLQISYLSQQKELLQFQMSLGRMVLDIKNDE